MDRWKSRGGKSQRGEEKKWEDQRGEKVRRKKMQVREKVRKSRFTVFFSSDLRLQRVVKRRVASHLARWKIKIARRCGAKHTWKKLKTLHVRTTFGSGHLEKCTPLWREARFQVKSVKNWRSRTTFGSWDEMSKKCTPLWREAHFQVKSVKNWGFWAFFWRSDVEKVHTN